jgi:hypothetical protein
LLTGSHKTLLFTTVRGLLPGTPQQRKDLFKQMLLQYFTERLAINIESGYFNQRFDSSLSEEPGDVYDSKYILFGTDFLSSKQMMVKFTRHSPTITRINGSHCLL